MAVPAFFAEYQQAVDADLQRHCAVSDDLVEQSMAYTLLAPSKRVRPVLTLLTAELCRGDRPKALPVAVAVEMVHASSLILDDLPSMDDAPLRRGKPSNHLKFGEAIAILAAFGLLNRAFGTIAGSYEGETANRLVRLFSDAVGSQGLVGGQAADLLATDASINFETLERIHRGKTGALFVAAANAGAITAGAGDNELQSLTAFAKNLGLAFQIIDDLLDVAGDPSVTGKATLADARKTTFVSFSGVAGARQLARELCDTADRALQPYGRSADRLRELSAFVAGRSM
jgi:geranylgeranyl diphosphate synthase type II